MTETNKPRDRKPKGEAKRKVFTDNNVLRLKPKRRGRYMIWDGGAGQNVQRGLGIWVSAWGTKSYQSMFYLPGPDGKSKCLTRTLGRVGEMTLAEAREQCRRGGVG